MFFPEGVGHILKLGNKFYKNLFSFEKQTSTINSFIQITKNIYKGRNQLKNGVLEDVVIFIDLKKHLILLITIFY